MKINIQQRLKSKDGILIVPIFKDQIKNLPQIIPEKVREFITKVCKRGDFKASQNEIFSTYFDDKDLPSKLLLLGLGSGEKLSVKSVMNYAGLLGKKTKSEKVEELNIILPEIFQNNLEEFLIGLSSSQFDIGKLKAKSKKAAILQKINLIIDTKTREPLKNDGMQGNEELPTEPYVAIRRRGGDEIDEAVRVFQRFPKSLEKQLQQKIDTAQIIGKSLELVKDLVNSPSNYVHGENMAQRAYKIAKENSYKLAVFGNKELKKMGFGGLLAVNQGAANEAKCIVLQYQGAPKKNEPPIAIVGKGIIFDTGGYNLKMSKKMEEMHQDMAGGATVLGIFQALRDLEIKKNVLGIIPIAENLVSDKAYRPSDIITMFSGHTVEITNTDAEGRLVLADAVSYGLEFKPQSLITIATLTGAVGIAVGNRYAGLLGNNRELRHEIQNAGKEVDDLGWSLPLPNDYIEKMKSKVADLRNYDAGSNHYAGASKGAAFLSYFVGKTPWCHIDIGGTAFTADPKPYQTSGATGHGLLMLLRFLQKVSPVVHT